MRLLNNALRRIALNHRKIPASIGWIRGVEFGGRKNNSMDDSAMVHLWAGQLSTINATFRLSVANMPSNLCNHLLKISEVIHVLDCATYSVGKRLSSLKYLGLALRPMIKIHCFYLPAIRPVKSTVTRSFGCFDPRNAEVVSGSAFQNRPAPSALMIFSGGFFCKVPWSVFIRQSLAAGIFADKLSP